MNRTVSTLSSLILLATFTGCASYKSPDMPKEQMAQVRETKIESVYISIKRIDGVDTDSFAEEMGLGNPFRKEAWVKTADDVFDIKPGKCTLDVMFERNGGFAHGRVTFNALSGKSYHVTGIVSERDKTKSWWEANPQYVSFAVKDDATGQIVSEES